MASFLNKQFCFIFHTPYAQLFNILVWLSLEQIAYKKRDKHSFDSRPTKNLYSAKITGRNKGFKINHKSCLKWQVTSLLNYNK